MSYARNQRKKLKRRKRQLPEHVVEHGLHGSWNQVLRRWQKDNAR